MKKTTAAANAGQNTNSTIIAPARKLYNKINFEGMDSTKKDLLEKIVLELEQAQTFEFNSKYRYIKVGINLNEAKETLDLKGDDWKEFHELLGLKERVEQRCRQIAGNKWFAKFTDEDAPKLHHLTQANMITMSKEEDEDKFKEMLKSNHDFSTPKATDDEIDEAFNTAYNEAKLSKISLEDYKTYCKNSVSEIIKIMDDLLKELEEKNSGKLYKPDTQSTDTVGENQESVEA